MLWNSIGIDGVLMKWNTLLWEKLTASLFCLGSSNPPPSIYDGYWVVNNVLNLKDTVSVYNNLAF